MTVSQNGQVVGNLCLFVSETFVDAQHALANEATNTVPRSEMREYGGLIYLTKDGVLEYNRFASAGDAQSIDLFSRSRRLPRGAIIVGVAHSLCNFRAWF